MTDDELAEIRQALAETRAAMDAWYQGHPNPQWRREHPFDYDSMVANTYTYITIPALLAEIERLRAENVRTNGDVWQFLIRDLRKQRQFIDDQERIGGWIRDAQARWEEQHEGEATRRITITVHSIAEDGYPDTTSPKMNGRVAFIFDGCIVSGWPLRMDNDNDASPLTGYWEANDDVGKNGEFTNVTHWVEFPEPLWDIEKE